MSRDPGNEKMKRKNVSIGHESGKRARVQQRPSVGITQTPPAQTVTPGASSSKSAGRVNTSSESRPNEASTDMDIDLPGYEAPPPSTSATQSFIPYNTRQTPIQSTPRNRPRATDVAESASSAYKSGAAPASLSLQQTKKIPVQPAGTSTTSSGFSVPQGANMSDFVDGDVGTRDVVGFQLGRPQWARMRQKVAELPPHIPRASMYIVDDALSLSPEESQSVIQSKAFSMSNPSLPLGRHNENYGLSVPRDVIYHQIPTIILHVNAGDLPVPPRPLVERQLAPVFYDPRNAPFPRRSPSKLSLRRPWEAFISSSMKSCVPVNPRDEVADTNRGFVILSPVIDRFVGPTSALKVMESKVLPFLKALTLLKILGTWPDADGPQGDFLLEKAHELTNTTDLQSRLGRPFSSKESALAEIERLDHSVKTLEAIGEYVLRVALDACALLGGVELPQWPACVEFTGAWLGESHRDLADHPAWYMSQCRARDLERWGVPGWIESPRKQYGRLEVTANALPTGDRKAESEHQRMLAHVPAHMIRVTHMAAVMQPVARENAPASLPPKERKASLERAILRLLDPQSTEPLPFAQFNGEVRLLLGPGIWSGKLYEPQNHAHDRVCWLKAREGAQESIHLGVIYASMEIPNTWSNSSAYVSDPNGISRFSASASSSTRKVMEASIEPGLWFGVEMVGYAKTQGDEAKRVAQSYDAIGYRFIHAPPARDDTGRKVPHSRFRIELLYKTRRHQQEACRRIRNSLLTSSIITVSTVDWDSFGYERLHQFNLAVDPYYINELFSFPLSLLDRESLLRDAPQYKVPAADRAIPSAARTSCEAVYLWRLHYFTLLEYDGVNALPGYSPELADAEYLSRRESVLTGLLSQSPQEAPSVQASNSARVSLPFAELPLVQLGQIAYAPQSSLPAEDVAKLRRLYLCLCSARRCAPFITSIFSYPGSPYRRLLVHVARLVKDSSLQGTADFTYGMGPTNSSAGVWDEKLMLDGRGRVRISMDPDLVTQWDAGRDARRVSEYVKRAVHSKDVARTQKRRKHKDSEKGKGKEITTDPA